MSFVPRLEPGGLRCVYGLNGGVDAEMSTIAVFLCPTLPGGRTPYLESPQFGTCGCLPLFCAECMKAKPHRWSGVLKTVCVPPLAVSSFVAFARPALRFALMPNMTFFPWQELRLPQMVENNEDPKMTAFAITVDAKFGTSTGISAGDRATTLRALADPEVPLLRRTNVVSGRDSRGFYYFAQFGLVHSRGEVSNTVVVCSNLPLLIALQLRFLLQVYSPAIRFAAACPRSMIPVKLSRFLACPIPTLSPGVYVAGWTTRLQPTRSYLSPPIHGESRFELILSMCVCRVYSPLLGLCWRVC